MEYRSSYPIYLQVMDILKKQLITGTLKPSEQLPSTRNLALAYQVNPNTAQRIYHELEEEGICYTKRGLGTFITESEDIINGLREPMAKGVIDRFVLEMKELGYNHTDMIRIIQERESEYNDNTRN